MTDAEVIAAIRQCHLKANIADYPRSAQHWDLAWVDPGQSIFGGGPYVKLPVDSAQPDGCLHTIRVYAPARLQRRLARLWTPDGDAK